MTSVPSLNQIGRKLAKLARHKIFGWLAGWLASWLHAIACLPYGPLCLLYFTLTYFTYSSMPSPFLLCARIRRA